MPMVLKSSGYMGIWVCGYVGIWVYGYMGMWVYGYVGICLYGYMGLWVYGYVGMHTRTRGKRCKAKLSYREQKNNEK